MRLCLRSTVRMSHVAKDQSLSRQVQRRYLASDAAPGLCACMQEWCALRWLHQLKSVNSLEVVMASMTHQAAGFQRLQITQQDKLREMRKKQQNIFNSRVCHSD